MTSTLVPQALDKGDLTEILKALTDAKPSAKDVQTVSKPSNTVAVTQEALTALSALSDLLKAVEVPSARVVATPSQRSSMMELASTAKDVVPAINAAVDAVREAIFNHFDVLLETATDTSEFAKDKNGHYLVKDEVIVPEQGGKRFTRELREQAPTVTAKDLRQAWQDGDISRADYFAATKHVEVPREVVPEQLVDLLKRKPKLLPIIGKRITPGSVTSAFYVRPPKVAK